MNAKTNVRAFAAILMVIGSCASEVRGALTTTISIDSPTDLTISISGILEPGQSSPWLGIVFNGNWSGLPVADFPADGPGQLLAGAVQLDRAFVGGRSGGPHLELNFSNLNTGLVGGATLSGTQTLTFDGPHNVTESNIDGAEVYHGFPQGDFLNGTFQGFANVPEPSSSLFVLCVAVYLGRRQRDNVEQDEAPNRGSLP